MRKLALKDDSDLAWERWGKQDPYFGVLTHEQFRKDNIAQNQQAFFDSGEKHIKEVLDDLERRFGPIRRASALDFGCGVGRLLIPLSQRFSAVTGVDVSKSMLEEAAKNIRNKKIENVELLESDDQLSKLGTTKFDFVHTFIVLQHIVPERGYEIVENLLQHLAPGGAFFIHVSLRNIDSSLRRRLPLLRKLVRFVRARVPPSQLLVNAILSRKLSEPTMEMNDYDLLQMLSILKLAGAGKVLTELESHGTYLSARLYSSLSGE